MGADAASREVGHLALWGKADPARADRGPTWHPLVAHLLDVAACAEKLLVYVRPKRLETMASVLGLSQERALPWLLFFVVLHDLGKATPAFQAKVPDAKTRLLDLGFDFPESDEPHGEMSVVLVPDALEALGVPGPLATLVARSVGAHHVARAAGRHEGQVLGRRGANEGCGRLLLAGHATPAACGMTPRRPWSFPVKSTTLAAS